MKITIGGDFCVTNSFLSSDLFDKNIIDLFVNSDFNIINLECPVTEDDGKNRIIKTGPHLRTDYRLFEKLKQLGVNALTLANNHILDYGVKGLSDTLAGCIQNGFLHVGAGINLSEASKPLIIQMKDCKIAFVNFCENEWSIATARSGGANPMNTIDNLLQIKKAKKDANFVIVIVHGGHEYYPFPSPRMVKQYRFYAENGADAVVGHHTHCIGGYEVFKDIPIIYSLGNFLFTLPSKMEEWYTGLLATLKIENKKPITFDLCPISQDRKTFRVALLNNTQKEAVMNQLKEINTAIADENLLQKKWNDFANEKAGQYLNALSPINAISNRYIRGGLNRLGISKLLLNKNYLKNILNHIRCEAHKDIISEIINKKLDKQ